MQSQPRIQKIISGGQTGVDQAALDGAIALGRPYGGWLPPGRKTEDGPLPARYQLQELASGGYRRRTEKNVVDSDGTLIISHGKLTGGSLLTLKLARKRRRPCLHVDRENLSPAAALLLVESWLKDHDIRVLNVAGPRASGDPRIYEVAKALVTELLRLQRS